MPIQFNEVHALLKGWCSRCNHEGDCQTCAAVYYDTITKIRPEMFGVKRTTGETQCIRCLSREYKVSKVFTNRVVCSKCGLVYEPGTGPKDLEAGE